MVEVEGGLAHPAQARDQTRSRGRLQQVGEPGQGGVAADGGNGAACGLGQVGGMGSPPMNGRLLASRPPPASRGLLGSCDVWPTPAGCASGRRSNHSRRQRDSMFCIWLRATPATARTTKTTEPTWPWRWNPPVIQAQRSTPGGGCVGAGATARAWCRANADAGASVKAKASGNTNLSGSEPLRRRGRRVGAVTRSGSTGWLRKKPRPG
jgi:hypothetical protein